MTVDGYMIVSQELLRSEYLFNLFRVELMMSITHNVKYKLLASIQYST